MKIICNQKEFAALVRECYRSTRDGSCCGCLFCPVCSGGADLIDEDKFMTRIEDICDIEVVAGGD